MDNWWPPNKITFAGDDAVEQVFFLLSHYSLRPDGWPPEGRDSGYVGEDRIQSQRAPFEECVQVWTELEVRLDCTGVDGKLLLKEVESGVMHIESLEYESRRAFKYLLGRSRKTLSYSRWKTQRAYRLSINCSQKGRT